MTHRDRIVWIGTAGIVLVIAAVGWLIPLEVSKDVQVPGKIFAQRTWSLERSGQGTLHAYLADRMRGTSDRYLIQSIERGDIAEFVLSHRVMLGAVASAGDTVGTLASALSDRLYTELAGDVDVMASEVRTFSEGAKEALIVEAQSRLTRTRERLALQESIVARLRALGERGAVSTDEIERARRDEVALRGMVTVVEAEIAVLESGARPSELELAASRLAASRSQLAALQRQRASFVVTTPIDGRVARPHGDSVLVRIVDTSAWIAAVAIPVDMRNEIAVGDTLTLSVDGRLLNATVSHLGGEVLRVAGAASVLATCLVESSGSPTLLEGLIVEATIATDPVRFRDRVRSELGDLFQWKSWWSNAARV